MKKWIAVVLIGMLLCGCGPEKPAESETQLPVLPTEPAKPTAGEIGVWIPEEAVSEAMAEASQGQIYSWDAYEMRLQTVDGGDIQRTMEQLTGMDYDRLTVMNRKKGDLELYQTVWRAAGEEGTLIGRAVVADDGHYHYCVSLTAPEQVDSEAVYDRICQTLAIVDPESKK